MHNLWHIFCHTVQRVPERPAIIAGDSQYTYSQWLDRANNFRHAYHALGLSRGDRVLFWIDNSFDIAAAITAAWGNDLIPVFIDAGCRKPQLIHAIETVEPKVVVYKGKIPELENSSMLTVIKVDDVLSTVLTEDELSVLRSPETIPSDAASIVFTSGSTGKPKGVVQSHGNLYRGCLSVASALMFKDDDSLLCPVPWSFDYGYGQLLSSIVCRITHVLPVMQNPMGICGAIEQHSPSILAGTPSLYAFLMSGMSPVQSTDLSSLRLLTNTGGTLHKPLVDTLMTTFSQAELVLNYGLTETYRSCYLPPEYLSEKPGSIGKPVPGVDIIVIKEDGSIAQPNEEGEIVHRGDFVFLGYWGNAKATAQSIKKDPLVPSPVINGANALFTGDIGYLDDEGFLYYKGRRDKQLKSMGVRVGPGEVEESLLGSDMLSQVAVFGLPHDLLGHEIWAAIVPNSKDGFEQLILERYARSVMSNFMLPRRYMVVEEFPLTTAGKTDYLVLTENARKLYLKR